MYRLCARTALAAACASTPAFAEPVIEEVIVTSSRIGMPLRSIGTSVSVITAEDIRAKGFSGLGDVLRTQPAVGISNNGGLGKATALRVRGEEGFRTLVLIDGMEVSDPGNTQVGPNFEHILAAGVERVEILRGTHGMMYGADAGGVVNIMTPRAERGLGGVLSAEGGEYGTRQFAGGFGAAGERADVYLSASDYATDGFDSQTTDTELRDDDGYENTTLHGRAGWNPTERVRLQAVGRHVDGDNEYDSCFSTQTFSLVHDCSNDYEQRAVRVSAEYDGEIVGHTLAWNRTESERQFYSEGRPSFGGDGETERLEYLGRLRAGEQHTLVYGADLRSDAFDDDFDAHERDQDGFYAEYQGAVAKSFYFTAGARYDDNQDFGSHTTWRTTAAYLIDVARGELKLKASYGTGFRAPSLYEISYNAGPFGNGVGLDQEESEGYDLGIEFFGDSGLHLEAVYFDQSVSQEIFFDFIAFSGYLQGEGETDSRGIELIADVPLGAAWFLNGNYTWNDTEDSSGDTRIRRPEHLANFTLTYWPDAGRLRVDLGLRLSRDAVDIDGSTLDDYAVFNLGARYRLTEALSLFGRLENALDEDYQELATYRTSGAAAYGGLSFRF